MRLVILLLLVLSALHGTYALKTSMRNSLRNQVLIDYKNAMIPILYKKIAHMNFPPSHKSGSVDIDTWDTYVDVAPISPAQIGIIFLSGTTSMQFTGSGFLVTGASKVRAKWHFIQKTVDARVRITKLGFNAQISFVCNGGKPNIVVNHFKIGLSSNDVSIDIGGGLINWILKLVINMLKGRFISGIVESMEGKLPAQMTEQVNRRLNTLSSTVKIGPYLSLHYSFPEAPFVRNDYLLTSIAAFVHPNGNPNPPPYQPKDIPEFDAAIPQGIQFFISDYVVKSAVDASFAIGKLTATMDRDINGHNVKMLCRATNSPSFNFINAIDVVIDALCDVTFDNQPTNRFALVLQLHLNLKEYIRAAVIFFAISQASFTKLEYKINGPVDIEWFKKGINQVLETAVALVNGILGERGFPLPVVKGIDYTQTVQYIKNGYMEIGVNPVFNITAMEAEDVADV